MSINKLMLVAVITVMSLIWLQFSILNESNKNAYSAFENIISLRLDEIGDELEKEYFCFQSTSNLVIPKDVQFYLTYPKLTDSSNQNEQDTLITNSKNGKFKFNTFHFDTPTKINFNLDFEYLPLSLNENDSNLNYTQTYILNGYKHYIYDGSGRRLLDTTLLDSLINYQIKSISGAENCEYRIWNGDSIRYESSRINEKWHLIADANGLYHSTVLPKLEIDLYIPDHNYMLISNQWPLIILALGLSLIIILLFARSRTLVLNMKKLNTLKSDFINLMTHEFNTPITNLKLTLNSFNEGLSQEKRDKLMTIINLETDRISDNINTLFQINKLSVDELKLNLTKESISELLKLTNDVFEISFEERKCKIIWKLKASDDKAMVDKNHLLNVFTNVIDNALKYSKTDPVIDIKTENQGNNIIISISDKGIGMKKELIEKVFDKYYRSESNDVQSTKGMGLGLFYSKKIIELHNGKIQVKSIDGLGTTVTISLPLISKYGRR